MLTTLNPKPRPLPDYPVLGYPVLCIEDTRHEGSALQKIGIGYGGSRATLNPKT